MQKIQNLLAGADEKAEGAYKKVSFVQYSYYQAVHSPQLRASLLEYL